MREIFHSASLTWRAIALMTAVLIAGCGTGAKFYTGEQTGSQLSDAQARQSASAVASKVIVLRWPALVLPDSRAQVVANDRKWIGVSMSPMLMNDTPPFAAAPDLVEASSTLFAAELYWAIRRLDPTVTVLLEPQAVTTGRGGQLALRSLVDPTIPTDLVVDYWAKTLSWQMLVSQSFNLAIQTAPVRSPGNCGLLLTTVGHQPMPWAYDNVDCKGGGDARNALQSNFLLDGEARPESLTGVLYRTELPFNRDEVLLLRTPGYADGGPLSATMNEYVKTSRPQRLSDAEAVPVHSITAQHARLVVAALPMPDPRDAQPKALATYVRQFDPALADSLTANSPLAATQQANLDLVRRLLRQESEIRAKRDERIARELTAGDFGRKFRSARDQAYSAYGSQMLKTWAGTFGAIALHGAALQSAGAGLGALTASNQATDFFNKQTEAAGMQYIKDVAPSLSALGSTNVSVVGETVQVEVSDQAGLRAALQRLYAKYKQ
jgi:hypothetical protein